MCRSSVSIVGNAIYTGKTIAPFHLSPFLWSYLKSKFISHGLLFHDYTRQSRVGVLEHGLLFKSIRKSKFWEHIRFETEHEFTILKRTIGSNILYGVGKIGQVKD